MDDKDIPVDGPSDWQPIINKADLAVLGKLGEEVCEAGSAIFRCIIQGVNEAEPRTGKINKAWLEDELADIMALMSFAVERFNLDQGRMAERAAKKVAYKAPWFKALEETNDDA